VSDEKRAELRAGRCPLIEPGVEAEMIAGAHKGSLTVTASIDAANLPDVLFISVGTPSAADGSTNLAAINAVFAALVLVADTAPGSRTMDIGIRSTLPPGTLARLEADYGKVFERFAVVVFPEFLREGSAMSDFDTPPQTVVGVRPGRPGPARLLELLAGLALQAQIVDSLSAEALKMASNSFHALKICFANEIGRIVGTLGGDPNEVMELFVKDTVLNVSHRYLSPGAPYGGACLPKDVRSIANVAVQNGVQADILAHCEASNASHHRFMIAQIMKHGPKTVGLLGMAFKPKTDDLRESPSVGFARELLAAGVKVLAHDFVVVPGRLTGVNRTIGMQLSGCPGFELMPDAGAVVASVDVVVVMHRDARYRSLVSDRTGPVVINVASWSL